MTRARRPQLLLAALCALLLPLQASCTSEEPGPVTQDDTGATVLDGQQLADATPPKGDAAPPKPDAAPPKPDAVPPKPDAAPPKPDAAPPADSAPSPDVNGPCKLVEHYFNGKCYRATGVKGMDYTTATTLCTADGAKVASIHSQAENDFIFGILPPLNQASWIGLKRQGTTYVWDDGSPTDYINWAEGEPNNEGGVENCAIMWGPHLSITKFHSKWNDTDCSVGRNTVICIRTP